MTKLSLYTRKYDSERLYATSPHQPTPVE